MTTFSRSQELAKIVACWLFGVTLCVHASMTELNEEYYGGDMPSYIVESMTKNSCTPIDQTPKEFELDLPAKEVVKTVDTAKMEEEKHVQLMV